ncbi:Phosphonoacetaldehyde hydrolase [Dyadobacter sp. CECT 9275]|uniref:Phosphonoacetaldehyde hydrolase n=2 Tax=Dyadobacter helix TaxID=2822344 RepID=A0A916JGC6_9BACT|nr:Phosphonoacetaldehyde hydrolase [Dyadobacter sp. CECT 9275]
MIKMAVFDMAGTTVDENNVVYKTLMRAINERQFDFTLPEVLKEGAGKEKLQAIRSILASRQMVDEVLSLQIFENFKVLLAEAYENLVVTEQPHATQVFAALTRKNISVVLNTGYNRETAERLIEKIGWKEGIHFDCLVTASDVAKNRPDPDMITWAMDKLGIYDPQQVIKVGDSAIDIREGQNAGCRFSIGITTGAHTDEQLAEAHPDFIINDLTELIPIIDSVLQNELT